MRSETIAVHGGFDHDPATKAVAVPIYQTVAYEFDSADHAAALFDLEAEGYRYSRIANPTNAVLEKRVAQLKAASARSASRPARPPYIMPSPMSPITAVTSSPRHALRHHATLLQHVLPRQGIDVRFARSDSPEDMAAPIDGNTRALFCESVGNPAGNICDIAALAEVAHARGVPLIVDNTVATPVLAAADRTRRRHCRPFAHQIHGRTRGDARRNHRRRRTFPLERSSRALSDVQPAG